MLFIWNGLGFLVPVIYFFFGVLIELFVDNYFGKDYYSNGSWPLSLSFFLAGVVCWFAGKRINTNRVKTVIDKETGEEFVLDRNHKFFFLKFEYWGIVFPAIAVCVLLAGMFRR